MNAIELEKHIEKLYLSGELEKCFSDSTKKALMLRGYSTREARREVKNAREYYEAIKAIYDQGERVVFAPVIPLIAECKSVTVLQNILISIMCNNFEEEKK